MKILSKAKVHYKGIGQKFGDYEAYEFLLNKGGNDNQIWFSIRISRGLIRSLHDRNFTKIKNIAAKAVEQHILGKIDKQHYIDDQNNSVLLNVDWYPGYPGDPEIIEDYIEFVVNPPDTKFGFQTP
jgi:hypothetical protein